MAEIEIYQKKHGAVFWLGFFLIQGGGFVLLWWQTNWKITLAAFLLCYGVLLQCHMRYRDEYQQGVQSSNLRLISRPVLQRAATQVATGAMTTIRRTLLTKKLMCS